MAKQRSRLVKDKKIGAYKATPRTVWGFERIFKEYAHSEASGGLWAHVRAVADTTNIKATVAYSPKITSDLFLEFSGKTYRIESIDPFEFNKTDLTITASEIPPPAFDEVEWEEV